MSGIHIVTEIKSLLIHACAPSYEDEDREQCLTMIDEDGDTSHMLFHPTRTPKSQGWEVSSGDNGSVYPLDINRSEFGSFGSWVVAGFQYKEDERITTSVLNEASIVKLSFTAAWRTSVLTRVLGKALHLSSPSFEDKDVLVGKVLSYPSPRGGCPVSNIGPSLVFCVKIYYLVIINYD